MYLDTAPAGEPRTRQLGISVVRTRVFAPSTGCTSDPILERYLTDMCALYGHSFDPDGYAAASRVCYTDMAACLLGDLQPLGGDVDLVLIAHTAPDADPRRSTACYLNEHTPGNPLAFAISDQGVVSPFTALRVLNDFATADGAGRAVAIFLDQTSLPYDTERGPQQQPGLDAGVALLLEPGGAGIRIEQFTDIDPERAAQLVRDRAGGRVVAGPGLDPEAPAGAPCTGVWAHLRDKPEAQLIAEYDTQLRSLALCHIEPDRRAA